MDASLPEGWTPTAPSFPAPGGEMRRLEGPNGEIGMAIKFRSDVVDHPILVDGLTELISFMRRPGHSAVAPLLHWDRRQGLFIYDIGDKILLADMIERCAYRGITPGERVAMELLAASANAIDGAAREAGRLGIRNHGCIDPWHVLVDRDGTVSLLGYGLPPVDAIAWLDEGAQPPALGLGYWPPERIDDQRPEGVFSDIYSIAVVAAELATGSRLIDDHRPTSAVERIMKTGLRVEVQQLGGLTRDVRQLLMELVHEDEEHRPQTAGIMGLRARPLMASLAGKTLADLVRGAIGPDAATVGAGTNYPSFVGLPAPGEGLDPLENGFVDGDADDDDGPTARIDPMWASPDAAPPPDPLWDDESSAEQTWETTAVDHDDEDVGDPSSTWDDFVDEETSITAVPRDDDWSEEVPRAIPAPQYETSGVFSSLSDPDEVPRDSDHSSMGRCRASMAVPKKMAMPSTSMARKSETNAG